MLIFCKFSEYGWEYRKHVLNVGWFEECSCKYDFYLNEIVIHVLIIF